MGILKIILGAAETAGGIALGVLTGQWWAAGAMIAGGAGLVLSGVGTLLSGEHQSGLSTTLRDPIAAQMVGYGRMRQAGTFTYVK